ncbi:MAG: translation initiation factor IF-2 [Candidatus Woesearchaeota archaeon]
MIRQPIITVLGHVDHGKTSVLDYLRGSTLANRESGNITQHIGATEVPLEKIKSICGNLLDAFNLKFNIPGLLFVDTPGHEAFTNLRKRGGSIADMAILVIDINQGLQPQTIEAIEILKSYKVPFIIAANKVDLIYGWKSESNIFTKNFMQQDENTRNNFNDKFYKILGQLSENGFDSNLYNKVEDYSKTLSVIPVSAKTGEGIPEILAMITGLSQKFLKDKLEINPNSNCKGTILEIKTEQGKGTTADVIIYDGHLKHNDNLLLGGISSVIDTKVKALLKTKALSEIRDQKSSFDTVDQVNAASGVKIIANKLDEAIPGAPIYSYNTEEEREEIKEKILSEIDQILVETEEDGVLLKADTLGSIEAAIKLFTKYEIPIKSAIIGDINKKDIVKAESTKESGSIYGMVLAFNVKMDEDTKNYAEQKNIPVILNNVIYKVVEEYEEIIDKVKKQKELEKISDLVFPGKLQIMNQYIFRKSGPAIFGGEVVKGIIKPNLKLINSEGEIVGTIKSIEDKGKSIKEMKKNESYALSVNGMNIGRNVTESEILYSDITERQFRLLKENKKFLNSDDIDLLKEIAIIKRKSDETWGI